VYYAVPLENLTSGDVVGTHRIQLVDVPLRLAEDVHLGSGRIVVA
jgi:hypothetical protein